MLIAGRHYVWNQKILPMIILLFAFFGAQMLTQLIYNFIVGGYFVIYCKCKVIKFTVERSYRCVQYIVYISLFGGNDDYSVIFLLKKKHLMQILLNFHKN